MCDTKIWLKAVEKLLLWLNPTECSVPDYA
jgi:hypothetical protein